MLRIYMLLAALTIAGCGSEVGNDGSSVGGSCEVSTECTPDSVCRTGDRFPNGYCALGCDVPEDCPSGSTCVENEGGICMVECATGCRTEDGYSCVDFDARGAGGTVSVCATPE